MHGSESETEGMGNRTCCCSGNGVCGRKMSRVWEMFDDVWAGDLEWDYDY
jgi:hypothetical protein